MKKWRILYLALIVMAICVFGVYTVYGDNIGNQLVKWGYSLGIGMRNVPERSNDSKNRNIVSYVNDISVYEDEIIERIEKNKAISNAMKSEGNSTIPPWGMDPFEFVYREKFELDYARVNGIEVSKGELEKFISNEKTSWESEEAKEILEQYLSGRGITEEEFFNEVAPPSYEKTILKNKVRNHILQNADMMEKSNQEKQQYLDDFFNENIKVVEFDKDFIEEYSE